MALGGGGCVRMGGPIAKLLRVANKHELLLIF